MDETDILKERKERILAYMESEGYVPIKRRDMRAMLSVPQEDREKFDDAVKEAVDAVTLMVQDRTDEAMNRYNRKKQ